MSVNQLVKLCFNPLQSCFSTLVLHLSKPLSHHVTVEIGAGAAANVSPMMAANRPAVKV